MVKMGVGIVAVVLVLSLLAGSSGCAGAGTREGGELKILSHSMTVHEFSGSGPQSVAVVSGRAQNVSNFTISSAMIAVDFYDKNKNRVAAASAVKQNLQPGEAWDFSVQTVGPDAWKVVRYGIAASTK